MIASSFDPIVAEDNVRPQVKPGTVVVVFDGSRARVLGGKPAVPEPRPPGQPDVRPSPPAATGESFFNTDNAVGRHLAALSGKAAQLGASATVAGGRGLASMLKRTAIGRMFGPGERYFLVDIGRRGGEIGIEADSADPGIPFTVTVSFICRVSDAAAVVESGVRDLVGYHAGNVRRMASDIAVNFRANDTARARAAIQEAFGRGIDDGAVELSGISVRVTVDAAAVALLRQASQADLEIAATRARHRVQEEKTAAVLPLLGSAEQVLAQWIATGDDRYRQVYGNLIESAQKDREEQIKMLELALAKGLLEPHEIRARYPDYAGMVLDGLAPATRPSASAPRLQADPNKPEEQ